MEAYNEIRFVTLTTFGTLQMTCNLILSASLTNPHLQFSLYVIRPAFNKTTFHRAWSNVCPMSILPARRRYISLHEAPKDREEFGTDMFFQIQHAKFTAAQNELKQVSFVVYFDNDVIIYRPGIEADLKERLRTSSGMLFQQGRTFGDKACAGVWAIASHSSSNLSRWAECSRGKFNEQQVMNSLWRKGQVSLRLLPLDLYMSGLVRKCIRTGITSSTCANIRSKLVRCCGSSSGRTPYLIHYNFLVGNEKEEAMMQDRTWFIR